MKLDDLVLPAIVATGLYIVWQEYQERKKIDVSRGGEKMTGITDISPAFVADSFWGSLKKTKDKIFSAGESGGADSTKIPDIIQDKMGDALRDVSKYTQDVPLPIVSNYNSNSDLTGVKLSGSHPVLGDLTGKIVTKAEADILTSEKVAINVPENIKNTLNRISGNTENTGVTTVREGVGNTKIYHRY